MRIYRKIVFLPTKLINRANDQDWLRSLGYYVRLKSLYKTGTIYSFNLRKAGELIKCSPVTLSHHLKILEGKGLVRRHCGNLTLTGLNKLKAIVGGTITTGVAVDRKNQFDLLRGVLIKNNLQRQAYKAKRSGITLRKSSIVPHTHDERASSSYLGLSCKGIGYLYGRSAATGNRVRKKLEGLGVIKSERVYSVLLSGTTHQDYLSLKKNLFIPAFSFFKAGSIILPKRNSIEWIYSREKPMGYVS